MTEFSNEDNIENKRSLFCSKVEQTAYNANFSYKSDSCVWSQKIFKYLTLVGRERDSNYILLPSICMRQSISDKFIISLFLYSEESK